MDTTEKRQRGRGRPATGRTTTTMRIPTALKPAVEAMVKAWRHERPIVFERRQPERQP